MLFLNDAFELLVQFNKVENLHEGCPNWHTKPSTRKARMISDWLNFSIVLEVFQRFCNTYLKINYLHIIVNYTVCALEHHIKYRLVYLLIIWRKRLTMKWAITIINGKIVDYQLLGEALIIPCLYLRIFALFVLMIQKRISYYNTKL